MLVRVVPGFFPPDLVVQVNYFSIVQRKVLTPNDFPDLNAVAERLLDFQYYWETTARPFEWKFTRQDLTDLLARTRPPR
jgi:hypothetical protein